MHELATVAELPTRAHLELVPSAQGRLSVIRCPSCGGLRSCLKGHENRQSQTCKDCRAGRVVTREEFWSFWLERFSEEEIDLMNEAIWG